MNKDNDSRLLESDDESNHSANMDKNFGFASDRKLYLIINIIVKLLMFGFGDSENPDPETMELLEQYIIEYVQNISILALKRSKRRGFSEIKLRDLMLVIKNDKKKYYRIPPLLSFYETLKKTKK